MTYTKIGLSIAALAVLAIGIVLLTNKSTTKSGFEVNKIIPGIKKKYNQWMHKGHNHYIGGIFREDVERQLLVQNMDGPIHHVRGSQNRLRPAGVASRDGFMSDAYHWPGAGTFGNLADTNPYGNYAGGADMYYPIYNDQNNYFWKNMGSE